MEALASAHSKAPFKFRIPTAEYLIPIRLDIEIDGQRFKDAFTWNSSDSEGALCKEDGERFKASPLQLTEFQSFEGQDMYSGETVISIKLDLRVNNTLIKDQSLWDLNNYESDPEEFSMTFCKDLGIEDPEPAIAFVIREQLYEIAVQNVNSSRESRMSKFEHVPASILRTIPKVTERPTHKG
ncbi:Chromatin structure-remodeling complex protein BSH [Cucurbita argyrosperma subsp. argyrosperma]|nr:Chromatin structure-remodeling complex protein BSH [Cucurbita argyrosperma subsp. argyrosperma]